MDRKNYSILGKMKRCEIIKKEGEKLMGLGRRKKAIRNLYNYKERRKATKNSGYPQESICPGCGRAIVRKGEHCRDCKNF